MGLSTLLIGEVMFWLILAILIAALIIASAIKASSRNRIAIAQAQVQSSPEYQKKQLVSAKYDEMRDDVVDLKREHFEKMTEVLVDKKMTKLQKAIAVATIDQQYGEDDKKRRDEQARLEQQMGMLPEVNGSWTYSWQILYDTALKNYNDAVKANPVGSYNLEKKQYHRPGDEVQSRSKYNV
jgi:hypothetical protein